MQEPHFEQFYGEKNYKKRLRQLSRDFNPSTIVFLMNLRDDVNELLDYTFKQWKQEARNGELDRLKELTKSDEGLTGEQRLQMVAFLEGMKL